MSRPTRLPLSRLQVIPVQEARLISSVTPRLLNLTNNGSSLMRQWLGKAIDGFVVVAWKGQTIVGWSLAFRDEPLRPWHCGHVFVDRKFRKLGVGQRLLKRVLRMAGGWLRVSVHDDASEKLFTSDPTVRKRLIIDWMRGGCRECGGHGMGVGLVEGKLTYRPCGICH